MTGSWAVTANFSAVTGITITTSPSGLSVLIDGATLTAPQSFPWTPGQPALDRRDLATGHGRNAVRLRQLERQRRPDAQRHRASTATTYTANFTTQYLLTTAGLAGGRRQHHRQSQFHRRLLRQRDRSS